MKPSWDDLCRHLWTVRSIEDEHREVFAGYWAASWEYDIECFANTLFDEMLRCDGEQPRDIGLIIDTLLEHVKNGRHLAVAWWTYCLWRVKWQVGVDRLLGHILTKVPGFSGTPMDPTFTHDGRAMRFSEVWGHPSLMQ